MAVSLPFESRLQSGKISRHTNADNFLRRDASKVTPFNHRLTKARNISFNLRLENIPKSYLENRKAVLWNSMLFHLLPKNKDSLPLAADIHASQPTPSRPYYLYLTRSPKRGMWSSVSQVWERKYISVFATYLFILLDEYNNKLSSVKSLLRVPSEGNNISS